jgi:hypothetical protein
VEGRKTLINHINFFSPFDEEDLAQTKKNRFQVLKYQDETGFRTVAK